MLFVVVAALFGGGCGARQQAVALPEPLDVIEYVIPWADAFPSDIVVDDVGRVWFTDRLTHAIGRLDPESGRFERFATPTAKSAPYGFVRGPDGGLWFGESVAGRLGRVDPETGGITEVGLEGLTWGGPHLLAVDGSRIWFTMRGHAAYGSYDPATGETAVYPVPERMRPYGIAASGSGTVWVSGYDGSLVLEIDTRTDSVRPHDLSRPDPVGMRTLMRLPDSVRTRLAHLARSGARVRRVSADGRGRLWMTDFGGGRVLALTRDDSLEVFQSLDRQAEPYGILAASSGVIWYNEKRSDTVVALDPATGERRRYRLPTTGAAVRHLAEDARRGRIWLPLSDRGRIGLIPLRPDAIPALHGDSMM